MKIVNPVYKLKENNIFDIRTNEYYSLLDNIKQIIEPVEEIGFEITECVFKEPRFSTGDISRTLKKTLSIRLQKGTATINLSIQIPKLIDGNYIIINGRKKIPQFQFFDIPIVTRGSSIKLRTNVTQIMVYEDFKDLPRVYISILGRKVPFMLVLFAYYGVEKMNEKFELSTFDRSQIPDNMYGSLLIDILDFYEESKRTLQDDIIKELGRYYSKYNAKGKGEDLIYSLDLIMKCDRMTTRFFHTGSILDELMFAMETGGFDDVDTQNKRIRCFEYMVLSKISKIIFDFCITNRTARQPKFNVNSTQILSECNVSDIIQFDFSINPIEELTKLSRTSLVGPGGFNKQNVPEHLRDINDTMFGRICPVDTPDRENCGVLQNLIPNVPLDKDLRFTEEFLPKQPISIPVSMVPFLEHDDQTRLQMSSSQQRQGILLQNFDTPMIQSGCEGLYTQHTQFVKIAKHDGEVVYLDEKFLIMAYNNETVDIFNISYRKIYISNLDVLKVYVKFGDKVSKGQIIAESVFCKDGNINIGRNLLTAVMEWYGYNYEDGIVISKRLQEENVFTSSHYQDLSFTIPPHKLLLSLDKDEYKPLPDRTDRIQKGDPYAIMKGVPSNQQEFLDIFKQEKKFLAKTNLYITECNIFVNEWNHDVPEYSEWVEGKIKSQQEKETNLRGVISEYLPKKEATKFIKDNELDTHDNVGKFKIKSESINGILVEMYAIFFRPIQVGDKIGNRHGNKGVISTIVDHEKMPQLPDGRHVDICINPLGIISRMNIGQLYELHLAMSLNDLKIYMKHILNRNIKRTKELNDEQIQKMLKIYVVNYIKIVDNTHEEWYTKQFKEQLPDVIDEKFIDDMVIIQAPFESVDINKTIQALAYTNTNFKNEIYEPIAKENILNRIATGYMYFFKMVHIAETRLAARGIGSYARKTLQPLAGRKHGGGQRSGEMEMACLTGHDASENLFEFLTTKSDCIDLKNEYIRGKIDSAFMKGERENSIVPESVALLNAYLTAIGVER